MASAVSFMEMRVRRCDAMSRTEPEEKDRAALMVVLDGCFVWFGSLRFVTLNSL